MSKIIWIASYPKSGNTWFRVFLNNLLFAEEAPININELRDGPIASNREYFDLYAGVAAADLTFDEVQHLRPAVYEHLAAESSEDRYMKIHDALTYTSKGQPIVSAQATKCAIYLVRNPLDVAVSYAHHSNLAIDETIEKMGNQGYILSNTEKRLSAQLDQVLGSWSGHVKSWTEEIPFPVHVIRYEDLLADPLAYFGQAVQFLGLEKTTSKIEQAVRYSNFEQLQAQEGQYGYQDKGRHAPSFFREGMAGSWEKALTEEQVAKIRADHGEVMGLWGYL